MSQANRIALFFAISGALGYCLMVAPAQTATSGSYQQMPDPTYEMVSDHWLTIKIEGHRQSWGKPAIVTMMTLHEPGSYLASPKEYALYWQTAGREYREDFQTREAAEAFVQFILTNSEAKK